MLKCWNVAMLGKCVGDNEPHTSRVHLSKHLIPFSRYLNQYYHPDDLCPYVASRNLIQFSVSFSMLASCVSPFNSRSIPFTNVDRPTDRTKTKQWRNFSFQQHSRNAVGWYGRKIHLQQWASSIVSTIAPPYPQPIIQITAIYYHELKWKWNGYRTLRMYIVRYVIVLIRRTLCDMNS